MILNTSTKLEIVLSKAKSTLDCDVHVDFLEWTTANEQTAPYFVRSQSNGSTAVTILAAPVLNSKRQPLFVSVYNADNATSTVTIRTNDGTNTRIITKVVLATLETLLWEKKRGWYVLTATGVTSLITPHVVERIAGYISGARQIWQNDAAGASYGHIAAGSADVNGTWLTWGSQLNTVTSNKYVYLYDSGGGAAAIETSNTAPVWNNTTKQWQKTADATRRLVGHLPQLGYMRFLVDAQQDARLRTYSYSDNTVFSNGAFLINSTNAATDSWTAVDCSMASGTATQYTIPPHAIKANIQIAGTNLGAVTQDICTAINGIAVDPTRGMLVQGAGECQNYFPSVPASGFTNTYAQFVTLNSAAPGTVYWATYASGGTNADAAIAAGVMGLEVFI